MRGSRSGINYLFPCLIQFHSALLKQQGPAYNNTNIIVGAWKTCLLVFYFMTIVC